MGNRNTCGCELGCLNKDKITKNIAMYHPVMASPKANLSSDLNNMS